MINRIRALDNEVLLNQAKSLAVKEREITLEILHHLREIYRRRLHALRGFNSIFDYATKELGYSDASAQRRLAAMRLLTEVPEIEVKIKSGELSLTNAAQAQKLFYSEAKAGKPLSKEEKKEILGTLENKSTREAEKDLLKHSSLPIAVQKPDSVKPLSPSHSEVRFVADQALLDQLELIKGFLAGKNSSLTLAELFAEMAKLSLASLQPKKPKASLDSIVESVSSIAENVEHPSAPLSCSLENSGAGVKVGQAGAKLKAGALPPPVERSRYIPVEVKRAVYHRDGGACCFVDPVTQRRCGSRKALQYDHVLPYGKGGPTSVANLRMICVVHNRVLAIESYGAAQMARFLTFDEETF